MANEFFTILTATGRSKLAHAAANGTPLTLTHMAVGSGNNGAYYNPTEAQTTLKKEVWRGPLNHLDVAPDNPNWIVAELTIPDNVGGFYIREVGLFDKEGNLIAVGRFPESYKPNVADGSNKQLYVRMILEVANTSAITLLVDTNVATATRQYVDSKLTEAMQTLDRKQSARAATTQHIPLSGLQTVDGVSLVANDRILVKNQSFAGDNGIYVVATDAWVRAADADTSAKVTPGLSLPVEEGTENADTIWMLVTDGAITLGTTPLEFDWVGRRNLAPITSPGFKGVPTAPTPAQFDNTTKLATTNFIQQALGNRSGAVAVGGSTSLNASHAGKFIVLFDSTGIGGNVALPNPSSVPSGTSMEIFNGTGAINYTLTTYSGIITGNCSNVIAPNSSVVATMFNGGWVLTSGAGNSLLGTQGYLRLPSGIIIQWGTTAAFAANSLANQLFPIAFPNAIFSCTASPIGLATNPNPAGLGVSISNTGITVYNWGSNITYSYGARWIAIGY